MPTDVFPDVSLDGLARDISHIGITDEIPLFWVEGVVPGSWMLHYSPPGLERGSFHQIAFAVLRAAQEYLPAFLNMIPFNAI